jgi:hypothetical protein
MKPVLDGNALKELFGVQVDGDAYVRKPRGVTDMT